MRSSLPVKAPVASVMIGDGPQRRRDIDAAGGKLFVSWDAHTGSKRYCVLPPTYRYLPVRDAAEAVRRMIHQGQVVPLEDGTLALVVELTERLEEFLAAFEAESEDDEDGGDHEDNGDAEEDHTGGDPDGPLTLNDLWGRDGD